jgi:hypothetical protein
MTTTPQPDQDRDWTDALEDLATVLSAFSGLSLLLRSQDDDLNPYALAKVSDIVRVLTQRFEVLLDTAIAGMMALRRGEAQACTRTPQAPEGAEA